MKKYINASNNTYNLKELLTPDSYPQFFETIGFTYISGMFNSTYATTYYDDLVLYGEELYIVVFDGAEYADEIIQGFVDGKLGIDEITEELGLNWKDYQYFEEI